MSTDTEASAPIVSQAQDFFKNRQDLLMNITPEAPFARCGIDLCGPFPVTEDKMRYAMVLVDYLLKFVEAKAIPKQAPLIQ